MATFTRESDAIVMFRKKGVTAAGKDRLTRVYIRNVAESATAEHFNSISQAIAGLLEHPVVATKRMTFASVE